MDNSCTPIIFGFVLYLLYVLVPLIPAVIIYKNFPDTQVGTKGVWGVLTINATGAFAAYLAVIAVGYFVIQNIQRNIDASNFDNSAWFVKSEVVLLSKKDNQYVKCTTETDENLKRKLEVKATPDYNQKDFSEVSFPMYYKDGYSKISFSYPGFETVVKTVSADSVKFDYQKRTIYLGKIELKEMEQKYLQTTVVSPTSSKVFTSFPKFTLKAHPNAKPSATPYKLPTAGPNSSPYINNKGK